MQRRVILLLLAPLEISTFVHLCLFDGNLLNGEDFLTSVRNACSILAEIAEQAVVEFVHSLCKDSTDAAEFDVGGSRK